MRLHRILTALLALATLLSAPLFAQEVVTVNGSGPSERDAIKHALAEAICRVNGASLETQSHLRQEVRDVIDGVEVEFSYENDADVDVRTASSGHIRSYELLSSQATSGGYEVSLRAVVLRFDPDNPRPGKKKTLVVERFTLAPGALDLDGQTTGEGPLLSFLQDELTTRLVRSRKFTVLARKSLDLVLREQGFLREQGVSQLERAKLGNLLGADYLVAGRVDYLSVRTDRTRVKLTGFTTESRRAELRATLTIYNVGSGAIEWEDSYTNEFTWGDEELKRTPGFRDDGALARSMIELATEELGRRFLMRTFPPRVMLIDSSRPLSPILFLNAGDALLEPGDELDLVLPGKELVDPDTGDVLGTAQRKLGRIVVTEVTPKLSHARLIDPTEALLEELSAEGFDPTELVCYEPN
jgi:TolB-like protein